MIAGMAITKTLYFVRAARPAAHPTTNQRCQENSCRPAVAVMSQMVIADPATAHAAFVTVVAVKRNAGLRPTKQAVAVASQSRLGSRALTHNQVPRTANSPPSIDTRRARSMAFW